MIKIILIILAGLLSGCASFVSQVSEGHPNRKDIPIPQGSTAVMLDEGNVTDTDGDGLVRVNRGAGPFRANVGRVEKDGNMVAVVARRVNWWIAGNYMYGGFPGLFVDFLDGAAYDPTVVYIETSTQLK